MIARLLILVVLVALGWIAYKKLTSTPQGPDRGKSGDYEHMIRCEHCGVHVPDASAIRRGDRAYCCREHADQGRE